MSSGDDFDEVRAEPDALQLARRATDLIGLYQQRSIELARLRKQAIERAANERGMTMTAVAAEIGLSKGRITQIRQSAPPLERVLFGVGPITVAVPQRAMPDRSLPVISAEDSLTAERMTELLDTPRLPGAAIPHPRGWRVVTERGRRRDLRPQVVARDGRSHRPGSRAVVPAGRRRPLCHP